MNECKRIRPFALSVVVVVYLEVNGRSLTPLSTSSHNNKTRSFIVAEQRSTQQLGKFLVVVVACHPELVADDSPAQIHSRIQSHFKTTQPKELVVLH